MAEMNFNCPSCQQLIACDEAWAGQQIQCPICSAALMVPAAQAPAPAGSHNPLVPKVPQGNPRLSIGQARHQGSSTAPQARRSGHVMGQKNKRSGKELAKMFAIWGVVLAALGAGGYFGYPKVKEYLDKRKAAGQQAQNSGDGGEVGHIANLNKVLDATDPNRLPVVSADVGRSSKFAPRGPGQAPSAGAGAPDTNLTVVPTTYTLDLTSAKIPEGKVNGMISATNFVADTVRLDPVGAALLLRLVQGPVAGPDLGFMIYLHLKPGEKLAGHTWKIAADAKGGPQVTKLWKPNPKFAAKQQNFLSGYVLDVELGELQDGQIPGKIYLSVPDPEQSFAGGKFVAQTTIGTPAGAAAAVPATTPTVPGQSSAEKAAFEKRYGIQR